MTTDAEAPRMIWPSIVPVWALALAGTIAVCLTLPPAEALEALGLLLAGSVLLTLVLQLATRRPAGYLRRAVTSAAGAAIVVAAASAVVLPLALG